MYFNGKRGGSVARMSGIHIQNKYCGTRGKIERTQRFPQYSDDELQRWFDEVAKGYCWKQASDRCLLVRDWVENSWLSDDDVSGYMLDLSMVAGAKIKAGELPVPDRHDGLYDEYRT
jgi:hypothetical protein